MRLAIVSDVHGGLAAFEAVVADLTRTSPDLVVHGGDLALHGARPAEVVDRVRELGWEGVVGNTDELLWRPEDQQAREAAAPPLHNLIRTLFEVLAPETRERLGEDRIAWLRTLPTELRSDGIALVHAGRNDLWRGLMPEASDEDLRAEYEPLHASTVVYGHIHRPYVRDLGDLTVANTGSAGLSFDGDPRASYVLVTDGRPEAVRVEYDIEGDVADLYDTGYPVADWLASIRRTGRFSQPPEVSS